MYGSTIYGFRSEHLYSPFALKLKKELDKASGAVTVKNL
jgi:hypothetical protein